MFSSILTPASIVPVLAAAGAGKAGKPTIAQEMAAINITNTKPAEQAAEKIISAGNRTLSIFNGIRSAVIAFLVISLIFFGIGCIVGDDATRARFRIHIPWVLFGVMLAMFSLTIASAVFHSFYTAGS